MQGCKNPKCGIQFEPLYSGQTYCSKKCSERARYLRRRPQRWQAEGFRICLECNASYTPIAKHQKYCSYFCETKVRKRKYEASHKGRTRKEKYNKPRKASLREMVVDYKRTRGCSDCPEINPVCLAFHHREPKEKLFTIAHAISHGGIGKEKLFAEIAKCDILCFNCHAKRHADEPVSNGIIREGGAHSRKNW